MELTNFDSRTKANTSLACHMRHPATGKLMYEALEDGTPNKDEPCVVMVRGTESREVQKILASVRAERAKQEAAEAAANSDSNDAIDADKGLEHLHERLARDMAPLVTGFRNFTRDGRDIASADPEDVQWFLNLQLLNITKDAEGNDLSFLGQIAKFSTDRGEWLGN